MNNKKKVYCSPEIKFSFSQDELSETLDRFGEAMKEYAKVTMASLTLVIEAYQKFAKKVIPILAESFSAAVEAYNEFSKEAEAKNNK